MSYVPVKVHCLKLFKENVTMSYYIQHPDLSFDEAFHRYLWRGQVVQGTTSVFDRVGYRKNSESAWHPVGCPDIAKSNIASSWGSAFHRIAEIILKGGTVNFNDAEKQKEAQPYIDSFNLFLAYNTIEPLYDENGTALIEYPMYSETYKYAGTLDFCGINRVFKKNSIYLADWKTSSSYMKSYALQTAAYEQLVREVFDNKKRFLYTKDGEVVMIRKNTVFVRQTILFNPVFDDKGYRVFGGDLRDWNKFLSLLNVLEFAA